MSAKLFSELKLVTDNLSLFMQQPTEKPLKAWKSGNKGENNKQPPCLLADFPFINTGVQ